MPFGANPCGTNTGSWCGPAAAEVVYAEAMSRTLTAFEPIAVDRYGASGDRTALLAKRDRLLALLARNAEAKA